MLPKKPETMRAMTITDVAILRTRLQKFRESSTCYLHTNCIEEANIDSLLGTLDGVLERMRKKKQIAN